MKKKFVTKIHTIEVELYKRGMEDGFSCIPLVSACKWKNKLGKYKQCKECKLDIKKIPYVDTTEWNDFLGNAIIDKNYIYNDNDYIEIKEGRKTVFTQKELFEDYDEVEIDTFERDYHELVKHLYNNDPVVL